MKVVEAKTFEFPVAFDGVPAVLRARVFIDDGKVIGVRHLKLFSADREKLPEFVDGKVDFDEVVKR